MNERRWLVACAIVVLAGCDNGTTTADSGPVGTDAQVAMLPLATTAEGPADFTCLGTETMPAPGEAVDFMAHLYDFQSGPTSAVPSIGVDIFPDNLVVPGCTGTCTTLMSNATGDLTINAPTNGWFAYRIAAGTGTGPTTPVLTIGYNRTAPGAGGTITLPSVSSQTIGFIPSLYRRMRLPGTGIVTGNVSDCGGDTVEGAILRVFRGDTEVLPGPAQTDFFIGYFNGSVPAATRRFTDPGGIYAAANIDPTDDPVRVEIYAVIAEGAEPTLVACEEVRMFPDAVTIISVGPVRNDYPAGSGCAGRI